MKSLTAEVSTLKANLKAIGEKEDFALGAITELHPFHIKAFLGLSADKKKQLLRREFWKDTARLIRLFAGKSEADLRGSLADKSRRFGQHSYTTKDFYADEISQLRKQGSRLKKVEYHYTGPVI